MSKGIKEGDWVTVAGEANECFNVDFVNDRVVGIHTGCTEPIGKCTKVRDPEKIHRTITYYINFEDM